MTVHPVRLDRSVACPTRYPGGNSAGLRLTARDSPQARGSPGAVAPDAVTRSPNAPVPAEDARAALAAEEDFVAAAVLDERLREWRLSRRRADVPGEAPEERPVAGPYAFDLERPGVGRLVPKGAFALGRRKVGGNRDAVGMAVEDLSPRELPAREANFRGAETKARCEAVVEKLEKRSLVRRLIREESAHPIRLTATGGKRS